MANINFNKLADMLVEEYAARGSANVVSPSVQKSHQWMIDLGVATEHYGWLDSMDGNLEVFQSPNREKFTEICVDAISGILNSSARLH